MKIFPDEEFSEESDKIFLFFYHGFSIQRPNFKVGIDLKGY